jgi:lysozyme
MPRIPRSEQTVGVSATPLPMASGDAGAVGRGIQQLGQGLGVALNAFADEQNKADEFAYKTDLSKFLYDEHKKLDDDMANYNGDGRGYHQNWENGYNQRAQEFAQRYSSNPKIAREAGLALANSRHSYGMKALNGQQQFISQDTTARAGGEIGRLAATVDGNLESVDRALVQAGQVIDSAPGITTNQRTHLKENAGKQIMQQWVVNATKAGANPDDLEKGMATLEGRLKEWSAGRPAAPGGGPQSSIAQPGTIAAVTDQSERSYNSQGYGDKLTGKITVNGNTYDFVNGGSKRGSIPHGEYEIQRYTSGEQRAREGYSYTRDAFQLSDKADNAPGTAGDKRTGLLIHDGNRGVTAGCIGIKGNFDQFKADLQAEMANNGGKLKLNLGPQQQAVAGAGENSNGPLRTSQAGIDAIKQFEGSKDQGWDVKQFSGPYGVKRGENEKLTLAQAESRMKEEVAKVENDMASKIKVPLSQNQHDAMVSLFYNIGTGKGRLDEVAGMINDGRAAEVPDWIRQYTKAGGEQLQGLVTRRQSEAQMFASDPPTTKVAASSGMDPNTLAPTAAPPVATGSAVLGQSATSSGSPGPAPRPPGVADTVHDHFYHQVMTHQPQIQEKIAAIRAMQQAVGRLNGMLDGTVRANPHDPEDTKLFDKGSKEAGLGQSVLAGNPGVVDRVLRLADNMKTIPTDVYQAVQSMAQDKDPKRRDLAYTAVNDLVTKVPNALDRHHDHKKLIDDANEYTIERNRGRSPTEAMAEMDRRKSPEFKAKAEERKKQAHDFIKDEVSQSDVDAAFPKDTFFQRAPTSTGRFTDASQGVVNDQSPVLLEEYKDRVKNYFIDTGDKELAKKAAGNDMRREWGVTNVFGGQARIVRHPIERHYQARGPAGQESFDWLKDQLLKDMREYATGASPQPVDAGKQPADGMDAGTMTSQSKSPNTLARLPWAQALEVSTTNDPNDAPAKPIDNIDIRGDDRTRRDLAQGRPPSYAVVVRRTDMGNMPEVVMDRNTGQPLRWFPDAKAWFGPNEEGKLAAERAKVEKIKAAAKAGAEMWGGTIDGQAP